MEQLLCARHCPEESMSVLGPGGRGLAGGQAAEGLTPRLHGAAEHRSRGEVHE